MSDANVAQILRQVSAKYVVEAKKDIGNALAAFKDLHPLADNFTFADGIKRPVVALSGTVPVIYRGSTYNIPVCIYLLDTHPFHPPICYVRPTQDMMIKPGQHVDSQGRVYLPYLSEWQPQKCDLIGLIQIMVMVFQDSCPVFARSAANRQAAAATQGTPYPGYNNTPYPQGGGGMPTPHANNANYPGYNSGYPVSTAGYTYTSSGYPPYSTPATATASTQGYQSQGSSTSTGTIGAETIRASVLSAMEDRVRRRLRETLGTTHAELQSIKKTREELDRGQQKLKGMLENMEKEEMELESTALQYEGKIEELDKILASASQKEELNIDDAIDTTAPLFKQLLKCFVEDNTIEDTIYYLGQSLKRGQIHLDTFLKHVRKLSRQQFVLRATMQKCRQKAGLTL